MRAAHWHVPARTEVDGMQVKNPLEELLLELDDSGITTDFWCAHCHA